MVFLGIDLGTTKIASVLIDTDGRGVIDISSREHKAGIAGGEPWEQLQEPAVFCAIAEELIEEASLPSLPRASIDGICITGQMHGILYVDERGEAVSPLFTWLDGRGALKRSDGSTYAQALENATGYRLAPGFGMVTHFYNRENGLVPNRATRLCTILDYVAMRLCRGSEPVTDATTAASIGLFDLEGTRFDSTALRSAGLYTVSPPRIIAAGSVVGYTVGGLPVFAPVADNQASFVGSVREPDDSVLVNVGTGGQVSRYVGGPVSSSGDIDLRPFPGNGYLQVGAALCSGKAYERLRTFFSEILRAFGAEHGAVNYEAMNALAQSAVDTVDRPANRRLTVDTRLAGTRADAAITGSIVNLTLENFRPADLARGFIEGIAQELYGYYASMTDGVGEARHLVGSGNALRNNPALRAALERRFHRKFELPSVREEAALGAALCAAVGAGRYPDYRSAGELVRYEQ